MVDTDARWMEHALRLGRRNLGATGENPAVIRADGGLVANNFVCHFIADMLDIPVEVPKVAETTALGAAYLAGLQAGVYGGLDEITAAWQLAKRCEPSMDAPTRKALYAGWKQAVAMVLTQAQGD